MASPRPPSSSNRAPNARQGGHLGQKKVERTPGTPRGRDTKEKDALQEPDVLKEYRLGECLGRGAFGSVYKAFNWGTGETVAVKQIKLGNLPKSELKMIAAEIDLLKNLKHDNIVKYLGFAKSEQCLNIILEYCENGSLHSICKNYGKFPENLVGLYMTQVLQGLLYLHDQGVIHRDIKGANILTTKDGKVKLADFGVSTSTLTGGDKEAQVVGTPYWMAPEVIELSGATTASDIWSLGATVIELLEGNPPYYNMPPMPALFAIVNDDHPPLPQGVSRAARDFLLQCFQKDPNLRVSARRLLKHAWLTNSRRADDPVPANYKEAVEEVKQWNEALRSPDAGSIRAPTKFATSHPLKRETPQKNIHNDKKVTGTSLIIKDTTSSAKKNNTELLWSPETPSDDIWDDDFPTGISPNGLHLPRLKPQDNFGGLLSSERLKALASDNLKAFASSVDLSLPPKGADSRPNDNWDANFEGDFNTIKAPMKLGEANSFEMATIRDAGRKPGVKMNRAIQRKGSAPKVSQQQNARLPIRARQTPKMASPVNPALRYRESAEDFNVGLSDDASVFDRPLELLRSRENVLSPKLFDIADFGDMNRKPSPRYGNKENSPKEVSAEIQKYVENDGDYSDFTTDLVSDTASEDGQLRIIEKPPKNSWPEDEDDEDDPFASLEQGFDEFDMQANIARDKHARMCANIESLVASLKTGQSEDMLFDVSEQLLDILFESEESKDLIMRSHGMIPILEVLDECTVKSQPDTVVRLLKIMNALISNDVEVQKHLCYAGGIPIMTKFAETKFPNDIRLESAAFVRQMYQNTFTLQVFVCAGGLNVLMEFLKEDYDEAKDLVLIGVNGIWNVFELQTPTLKNDFCRIFSRNKTLSSLSEILTRVLDDKPADDLPAKNKLTEQIEDRIVSIFYLFSQAENFVKEAVADRMVLKSVLKDLKRMSSPNQVTMLRFIKNLSMLSTTLDAIHSSNAMEVLIKLVERGMKRGLPHFREHCNQVLIIMFNLCRLNKARQEDAAREGIISLLLHIIKVMENPPKEFILPILCDMAHSGKTVTKYLWQNNGLEFYVSLLSDQYWQVTALDAIFQWHQEETARVEKNLLEGNFSNAIVECFNIEKFDYNFLDPLQKLLRLSPAVAATLARPEMFFGIKQKLSNRKPDIRLNLLRLIRSIWEPKQGQMSTLVRYGLLEAIQSLAEHDPAVLVKNMATEFVKDCVEKEEKESSGGSRRVVSGYRRSSSYNIQSSDHTPTPIPSTPTQKSRVPRQLSSTEEPPVTPQRRPITPRDASSESVFRERNRESGKPTPIRRPSVDPDGTGMNVPPRRPSVDSINLLRRTSGDAAASAVSSPNNRSRLSRAAALKSSSRSSMAAALGSSTPKEYSSSTSSPAAARRDRERDRDRDRERDRERDKERDRERDHLPLPPIIPRSRGETKSIDSGRPSVSAAASAFGSTASSRRRTKTQTSQDLR